MKKYILLVVVALFIGITGFHPENRKERKARQQLEMAQLIKSGRFRFVAHSAMSDLGNFNDLGSNCDLVIDSLNVKASLPYFGRAYSVPYDGSGGVNFESTAVKIDKIWSETKKSFTISMELADSQDSYSISLSAGLDGYADLMIHFRNRQWISYYGIIEKTEPLKKP
jgi:hypothetical protein